GTAARGATPVALAVRLAVVLGLDARGRASTAAVAVASLGLGSRLCRGRRTRGSVRAAGGPCGPSGCVRPSFGSRNRARLGRGVGPRPPPRQRPPVGGGAPPPVR